MNKKTGEFSAADLKKPAGRKEKINNSPGVTYSNAKTPGRFVCIACLKDLPDDKIGQKLPNGRYECKACTAKVVSIVDGTYRTPNGRTHEAYKQAKQRAAVKHYKSGKLPKWMFS